MEIKRLVKEFNKTKDSNIYKNILDVYYPNRQKCICCGLDIIYPQTLIHMGCNNDLKIVNASYKSEKVINNNKYTLKVCKDCLCNKFEIKNLSRVFNVMCEATKFAFQISDDDYKSFRKKYAYSLEKMIKKFGETEGKIKWKEYCKRQSETNTFEYKHKVYGWTKEQFDAYNQSRACTLNNFIKRYGETEGKLKWDEYCKIQHETKTWDYMVKTHGIERARQIIKDRLKSWEDKNYSKISQSIFKELDKYFCPTYTTYYAEKNEEYKIFCDKWIYSLDYFIKELNICIEFNGTVFHADPRIYERNSHPNPFYINLTAEDIWKKDEFRKNMLEKIHGIKTYIIWELDCKEFDFEEFVNKILKENIKND